MRRRCGERRDRADQKAAEAHRSFSRNGGFLDETVGYHTERVGRRGGGEHGRSFLEASAVLRACGGRVRRGRGGSPRQPRDLPFAGRPPAGGGGGARRKGRTGGGGHP